MNADAWAIHYGAAYKVCTFDHGRAPDLATHLHGTIHPMGYLDKTMELLLTREPKSDCTIGDLSLSGKHLVWVCEDPEREVKIKCQTAIARGRYRVKLTWSQRFGHTTPQLIDVPNFTGIRIHPGNTVEDTEGCLLPGLQKMEKTVGQSVLAYRDLSNIINEAINDGEEVWITIVGPH